jgi:hypothetical protein
MEVQLAIHRTDQSKPFPVIVLLPIRQAWLMPRVARFWDASSRFGQPRLCQQQTMCPENSGLRRNSANSDQHRGENQGAWILNPPRELFFPALRLGLYRPSHDSAIRNPSVPMKLGKSLFEDHDDSLAAAQQGVPFPSSAPHKLMVQRAVFPKMECGGRLALASPHCSFRIAGRACIRLPYVE